MPPDYRTSFSGSALPFATESMAFNPSQLPLHLPAPHGVARTALVIPDHVREPNFYYVDGAFTAPRAKVRYTTVSGAVVTEMVPISGVRRTPGRSLTHIPRAPSASSRAAPVITQEALIRQSAQPWMVRARA